MRKFTFLLTLALFTTLTFAQAPLKQGKASLKKVETAASPEKLTPVQRSKALGSVVNGSIRLNANAFKGMPATRKAPKKAENTETPEIDFNVISEQPEGELKTYVRSGGAFTVFFGYIIPITQGGMAIDIVTAPDGKTVYFKDIVSAAIAETWVKGTIEGNKIHVPLYQSIIYYEDYGYGLALAKMKYVTGVDESTGEAYATYEADLTATEITFTINDDASISLDGTETDNTTGMPKALLSLVYTDNFEWSGNSDYESVYREFNDVPSTMPEGLDVEQWSYQYNDGTYSYARLLEAAIDGDKFYIRGVSEYDPESIIIGTIADGKVTFASDQYLGNPSSYMLYFCGGKFTEEVEYYEDYDEYYTSYSYTYSPELVFDYDADNKRLTSAADDAIIINCGKGSDAIDYMTTAHQPKFGYFEEVPATPADPEVIQVVTKYFEDYGYNGIAFDVKAEDVDGNMINPSKLNYIFWVKIGEDEEPFVFYADEYYSFAEDGIDELTEVPYYFVAYDAYDNVDIAIGGSEVYFYQTGFDDYGIQSVYYGGDERHESNVSWYSQTNAISSVSAKEDSSVKAIYSIDGKKLAAPCKGINIMKMGDGSVRKVLVK